jgi:VIT1/CCC1 family predicted Fe2+/Mn2+ transporter
MARGTSGAGAHGHRGRAAIDTGETAGAATDQSERSPASRAGWLRAAVLGADDGIVSTAALIVGVAASNASPQAVVTAGLAGLVAGAASMAVGEYVSVSSQRDLERVLYRREQSLAQVYPNVALTELAIALQLRGIDPGLARKVAQQISAAEPIGASVRVKYGISEITAARPLQAALASASSFAVGAAVPLLGMLADTPTHRIVLTVALVLRFVSSLTYSPTRPCGERRQADRRPAAS